MLFGVVLDVLGGTTALSVFIGSLALILKQDLGAVLSGTRH